MGQTACEKCGVGTYQAETGQDGCLVCPLNSYAPNLGSTSCIECPPGQIANAERSACVGCPSDTVRAGGEDECTPCEAPDQMANAAQTECMLLKSLSILQIWRNNSNLIWRCPNLNLSNERQKTATHFRLSARWSYPPPTPPLGNFADKPYLKEQSFLHRIRDVCTL